MITTLLQVWRLLDRGQRVEFMLLQLLSLVMALTTVAGVAAVAPFFGVLADPSLAERQPALRRLVDHFALADPNALVTMLGAGFVAAVLLSNVVNLLGSYLGTRAALDIGNTLQSRLLATYLRRPYVFHTSASGAQLFNAVVYEASRFGKGVLHHAFALGTSLATVVLIVLAMAAVDALLTAMITGLLLAAYGGFYWLTHRQLRQAGREQIRLAGLEAQTVTEAFAAIREVIVSGSQRYFQRRFARLNHAFVQSVARAQLLAQSPRHVMETVAAAAIVASILLLDPSQGGRGLLIAQLVFLGLATYRLLPALQGAYNAIVRIRVDGAALQEVLADLVSPPQSDAGDRRGDGDWQGRPRNEIELHGVTFRYPGGRGAALTDLSVRIPAGQITGLVGPNGSGKTTLADLVAGLLTPDAGRIVIDGVTLDESNVGAWQAVLAYVPQQTFLLDASIAENIAIGVNAEQIDRDRVRRAAAQAQLHEWVSSLPRGYDAPVGEGGVRVSGGQRQRIAIARGLYRSASTIILDEATSSLDTSAEQDVMGVLRALRAHCTIVVISHRGSTLEHCDRVIELRAGRLLRAASAG